MSNTHKDGGPAFPKTVDGSRDQQDGMSLRDYFAGQALNMCLVMAQEFFKKTGAKCLDSDIASAAYDYADAMLAEREKKK